MSQQHDIPMLTEELDRKVVERLEQIDHCLKTRRMGVVEARGELNALWAATSGLAKKDLMDAIAEMQRKVADACNARTRVDQMEVLFGGNGQVVVLRDNLRVTVVNGNTRKDMVSDVNLLHPAQHASEVFNTVVERFKAAGYQPVSF